MIEENWNDYDYIEDPGDPDPLHPPENRAGILPDKTVVEMRASFITVLAVFGGSFLAGIVVGLFFL